MTVVNSTEKPSQAVGREGRNYPGRYSSIQALKMKAGSSGPCVSQNMDRNPEGLMVAGLPILARSPILMCASEHNAHSFGQNNAMYGRF